MKKFAIISCVQQTSIPGYSNAATLGVEIVAKKIYGQIKNEFGNNCVYLGPNSSKQDIIDKIRYVREKLDFDGLLFFYHHGHGDTISGEDYRGINDESKDQVLICAKHFLIDDVLDWNFRAFRKTQRIFSIIDSCSSESVVEWNQGSAKNYPKIIHLASSRDNDIAYAYDNGGILSNKLAHLFYAMNYRNFTYHNLAVQLKLIISNKCYMSKINADNSYLNKRLFT